MIILWDNFWETFPLGITCDKEKICSNIISSYLTSTHNGNQALLLYLSNVSYRWPLNRYIVLWLIIYATYSFSISCTWMLFILIKALNRNKFFKLLFKNHLNEQMQPFLGGAWKGFLKKIANICVKVSFSIKFLIKPVLHHRIPSTCVSLWLL